MAEESAPPEASSKEATPPEGKNGEKPAKKASFFSSKIVLIAGTAILGLLLGAGGMFFLKGDSGKTAKTHEKEGKKEKKKEDAAEAHAKEEGHAEKPEAASHGAAEAEPEAEGKGHGEKEEEKTGYGESDPEEGHAKEEEGAEEGGHGGEGGNASLFKFEPVIVNVVEKNSLHYLKLQMALDCSNPETIEEIKAKTSELRDALLFLINDMTLREILSSTGKSLLKDDIKASFNRFLKKGEVKKIYFTDFTIQ